MSKKAASLEDSADLLNCSEVGLEDKNDKAQESHVQLHAEHDPYANSCEMMEEAQAIAMLGSWHFDPVENFVTGSKEFYRLFGLAQDQHLTMESFMNLIHPDDRSRMKSTIRRAMKDRKPYADLDFRVISDDGSEKVFSAQGKVNSIEAGDLLNMTGTVQDVTEHRRMERRISYLSRFPSENPNPVLRIQADGILRFANEAAGPFLKSQKMKKEKNVPKLWKDRVTEALQQGAPLYCECEVGEDAYSFCVAPIQKQQYANLYGTLITEIKKTHKGDKRSSMLSAASQTALNIVETMKEGIALIDMDGTIRTVNAGLTELAGIEKGELEGKHVIDVLPLCLNPKDMQPAIEAWCSILEGEMPDSGVATIKPKSGRKICVIPRISLIKDDSGAPVTIVATIQNVSDIIDAHEEVLESEKNLSTLNSLLRLFTTASSQEDYVASVVELIQSVSGYRCVGIRLSDEKGETSCQSYLGFSGDLADKKCWLWGGSRQCFCNKMIDDWAKQHSKEEGFVSGNARPVGRKQTFSYQLFDNGMPAFRLMCSEPGMGAVAVIPIRCNGKTLGIIHLADDDLVGSSEQVLTLAENMTPLIWEAIDKFNVERMLRRLSTELALAEEKERKRLASALHDSVGQSLSVSKLKLGALRRFITDEKGKGELKIIRDIFEDGIQQLRSLTFKLSPPILYELGLDAALEWLGDEFEKEHAAKFHFEARDQVNDLNEVSSVLMFQSAREIMANIGKHANAKHVNASICSSGDYIHIVITDDGEGFDTNALQETSYDHNSFGLFSIRERMRHVGGTIRIDSAPGEGTTVALAVPADGNVNAEDEG